MTGTLQNQKTFFSMGTVNTITVSEKSDEALAAAKERVKKIESKLSATSPDSEISVINKNAGVCPTTVSPETFRLIKRSLNYSELTDRRPFRYVSRTAYHALEQGAGRRHSSGV